MIFDDVHETIEIIQFRGHGDFELAFLLVLLYTMTMIFDDVHEGIKIIDNFEHYWSEVHEFLSSL